MSTAVYVVTSLFSLIFCNVFFLIFHFYQAAKTFSNQLSNNDDFLWKILALSIQVGNFISNAFLFLFFWPLQNDFLLCSFFNLRSINNHVNSATVLLISVTRFMNVFFPKFYSRINQFLISHLIKIIIIFIPAYNLFIVGHTCGLDGFCPIDFRHSLHELSYSETSEYQSQVLSLISHKFSCHKQIGKFVAPVIVSLIVFPSLCVFLKLLTRNFSFLVLLFPQSVAAPAMELRTISATVDSSTPSPSPSSPTAGYSLSISTGLLSTVFSMYFTAYLGLAFFFEHHILHFMLVELLVSVILPIIWCLTNTEIIILGYESLKQKILSILQHSSHVA